MRKDDLHRPNFSGRRSGTPGGRPAQPMCKQISSAGDHSNAKPSDPELAPFSIEHGPIAVPRGIVKPVVILIERFEPPEPTLLRKGDRRHTYGKQCMVPEGALSGFRKPA